MLLTLAIIITSFLDIRDVVAFNLKRSISSFTEESFSIKVSVTGKYASG